MASYLPPTEDLPIFDNQVFSQNDTPLTYGEAKKYFVTFPSSQGPTTITDLIAGAIEYSSPVSGSFFDIGTNQVSGGTVRIGPTGTSSVSVHAGNMDFTNNTINNATDALLNNISLGNSQTSGVLNIATNALRTGNLNINSTSGSTNTINIGAIGTTSRFRGALNMGEASTSTSIHGTVDIGESSTSSSISGTVTIGNFTTSTTINGIVTIGENSTATIINGLVTIGETSTTSAIQGTVNIGTTLLPTTILGPVTSNEGITLGSSKYISTSHTGTITLPTSLQVGYTQTVVYSAPTLPTTAQLITMRSITLNAGVWILKGAVSISASQTVTHGFISFGDTSRPTTIAPVANDSIYGNVSFSGVTVSNVITPNLISFVSPTTTTTFYFNISMTYTGTPVFNSAFWKLLAQRIA